MTLRKHLVVMIELGRADGYRSHALELAPPVGLRGSQPLVFELVAGGWRGTAVIEGAPADCDRDIALHLQALATLSRENPGWPIRIEIEPDGGVLELQAGSFGDSAEDVAALVRWTTPPPLVFDGAHAKLYVSVRLPEDAHRHFLDLVVRQLPMGWPEPVTDAGLEAIALGFELTGDASYTAQVISALRHAWLLEGSGAQCLIELEGDPSIVRRIDALHGWTELERELRAVAWDAALTQAASTVSAVEPEAPRIEIARGPDLPVLGSHTLTWLTWIEGAGRIRGLGADGVILELPERVEAVMRVGTGRATYCRRPDGSSCLRYRSTLVELPHEPEVDRRVHGGTRHGLLLTERRGADTRLRLLDPDGVHDGPLFRNLKAVVLADRHNHSFAMAVGDVGGFASLVTIDLATWGWDRSAPWPITAEVTDLAALGASRLVGVANLDGAGQLYVVTVNTDELEHAVYLPCVDPRIVCADGTSVWITGASPSHRASRVDLFRVDLAPSVTTTVLTGGVNAGGWGALHAARRDDGWLLAYERRGVFVLGDSLEAVVALEDDEQITSVHTSPLLVVSTTGPEGSRLLLGDQQPAVVHLPSPAYEPLLGSP